jgi:uncharacterized protein
MSLLGRGLAFPVRIGDDGRIVCSEDAANVRDNIVVILRTAVGERLRLPSFGAGLEDMRFEPNEPVTHHELRSRISDALRRWEPRIALDAVDVVPDAGDPEAAIATVSYRLLATQTADRLSVAVPLQG